MIPENSNFPFEAFLRFIMDPDLMDISDDHDDDDDILDLTSWTLEIPVIDRIVFNDPATIVFWCDGTKTVVKCMEGEKFERYAGFCAAVLKKMFGSTAAAKGIMEDCDVANWKRPAVEKPEPAQKKPAPKAKVVSLDDLTDAFAKALAGILKDKDEKERDDETSAE